MVVRAAVSWVAVTASAESAIIRDDQVDRTDTDEPESLCVFAPSPLLTVTVEHDVHEHDQLHVHVGGQGIWIARMVRTLGMRPQLCAVFGGETGQVARFLAELEELDVRSIRSEAWNGGYVHDRRGGDRVELVDVPPSAALAARAGRALLDHDGGGPVGGHVHPRRVARQGGDPRRRVRPARHRPAIAPASR